MLIRDSRWELDVHTIRVVSSTVDIGTAVLRIKNFVYRRTAALIFFEII